MKKILAVFVALVLVFALCAMPASAETKASEWKKGTGPVGIDFSDEGTKILIDEGVNLYYYQNLVNVKDFTVKFKVNAPDYSDHGCYVALTIGGNGKYTGAQGAQNFIVMWIRDDHLCIDPQIFSSNKISSIGFLIYGFTPKANSPTYLAPSSVLNILLISSLLSFLLVF